MVDIITNATNQVFGLEEYCELVTQRVDMADIDSMREHAWLLRGLANNRDFLLERYHRMIEEFVSKMPVAVYTPQSLTLASGHEFYVRANIWLPIENSSIQSDTKVKLNAYELPHDHSFDFVSVGYFGDGYVTDIYQYDGKVTGFIGEHVDITCQGRFNLDAGTIFVYEANKDIHIQLPPKSVSISLNLMQTSVSTYHRSQYVFDLEQSKIASAVTDQVASRIFMIDMFKHLHNDESVDLLSSILSNYPCAKARARALGVLTEIRPNDHDYFLSRADKAAMQLYGVGLASAEAARKRETA